MNDIDSNKRSVRIAEWACILAVFFGIVLPKLCAPCILVLIVCFAFHKRHAWHPMHWVFLALGVWSIISTTVQIEYKDRWSSHDFTFLYNWLPILLVPALPWDDERLRKKLIYFMLAGISIAGFIILIQGFWSFSLHKDNKPFNLSSFGDGAFFQTQRPNSTYDNALKFAAMFTLSCLSFIMLTKYNKHRIRLTSLTIIIWTLSLYLNKTRLAILAFITIIPLRFIKNWTPRNLALAALIGLCSLASIGTIAYQFDDFKHRINRIANLDDGRIAIWKLSWANFQKEPVLGYGGIRHSRKAFSMNADPNQELAEKGTHAHNSILAMACSYGVIGLALWLTAQIWLLSHCWKQQCRMAVVALLAYHCMGMLEDMAEERALTSLTMFLVAIDLAWNRHKKPNDSNGSSRESIGQDAAQVT